jgi:hypothetical protein
MTSFPRRSVLKGAGALSSILLAPKLPLWSLAEAKPAASAPTDYVNLSSDLLGIAAATINPSVSEDDVFLADVFYSLGLQAGPGSMQDMLTIYGRLSGTAAQKAQAMLVAPGGGIRTDPAGIFARLTMMCWLFGVWYGGTEVSRNYIAARYIAAPYQNDFIVSARAYKAAWIWRIAQAHPMGFSQFNFGSWASPPPSLTDYGIQT